MPGAAVLCRVLLVQVSPSHWSVGLESHWSIVAGSSTKQYCTAVYIDVLYYTAL